jgi:hypothetical protein
VEDAEAAAELEGLARRHRIHPDAVAGSLLRVQEAQELAAGNVNPQLVLADLLRGVRRELLGAAA